MLFQASNFHVHGLGRVHAIHLNITAAELTVDDLGQIIGDYHNISCSIGEGFDGYGPSGKMSGRKYFK